MGSDIIILLSVLQTLYTYPNNFRAYKALIASKYSGANVKVATDFKFGETNKTKDFLAKFPLGKVRELSGWNPVNREMVVYLM